MLYASAEVIVDLGIKIEGNWSNETNNHETPITHS